jgi:DNA processing protein
MSEHSNTALPEEAFAAALAAQPRVGPSHLRAFLCAERPAEAWEQYGKGSIADVARLWRRYEEAGVSVLTQDDPDYPSRLHGDPEAPAVLFCRGNPAVLHQQPTVALVGTRSPTRYGIGVAAQLGAELAATGVSVVSGLALGIDGAAHEGACTAGAPPLAVVAGGLGDPYPRRHERLWERVAAQGAIVSESPLGVRTEKWRFPVRNRLLAGLSDVVVVVPAGDQGRRSDDRHGEWFSHRRPLHELPGPGSGPVRGALARSDLSGPTGLPHRIEPG